MFVTQIQRPKLATNQAHKKNRILQREEGNEKEVGQKANDVEEEDSIHWQ